MNAGNPAAKDKSGDFFAFNPSSCSFIHLFIADKRVPISA